MGFFGPRAVAVFAGGSDHGTLRPFSLERRGWVRKQTLSPWLESPQPPASLGDSQAGLVGAVHAADSSRARIAALAAAMRSRGPRRMLTSAWRMRRLRKGTATSPCNFWPPETAR